MNATLNPSRPVPEATLRRLPLYHRLLKQMQRGGVISIACPSIGAELLLDPTQVRKDLEITGIVGKPRVGYVVTELIAAIENFLGWNNVKDAFLAGAGSLGAALLGYMKFEEHGLSIVATFDNDPNKIGTLLRGRHVLPIEKLTDLATRMHIHLGIITVPATAAQQVADRMVAGGIRAIWNFAPVMLHVPDHVIVRNEDLYCSLASLSQKLAASLNTEGVTPHVPG
jgi:redox-sensing transcriptional repressor